MSIRKFLVLAGLLFVSAPVVIGEAHCPGSATSLPLRPIQNALFVTSINVNGTGPYDFLVDTGAQVNTIDDALATTLHLTPESNVGVSGAATYSRSALVRLDLAAARRTVTATQAVIVPAAQLRAIDPHLRGILGGTFLEHFDLLLDNQNRLLCLDDSGSLSASLKGQRIALADPITQVQSPVPFTRPLVISANLSAFDKPMILTLDSGSNSPFLFPERAHLQPAALKSNRILKRVVSGVEQDFLILPPQEVRVEKTTVHQAQFAMPINSVGNGPAVQEDGVLPTIAYRRVFISPSKGYVLLDPWN